MTYITPQVYYILTLIATSKTSLFISYIHLYVSYYISDPNYPITLSNFGYFENITNT